MDRTQLLRLLPHQGHALWLDSLLEHDPNSIHGLSDWKYLDCFGKNASPCLLFEAAAQLCAAHGALYNTTSASQTALIGKISDMQLHHCPQQRSGKLQLRASQKSLSPAGALYGFSVYAQLQLLIDGKLLLVLKHA